MNEKEIIIESKLETKAHDIDYLLNCANCFHFTLFAGSDCVCVMDKRITDPRSKCNNHRINRDDN